MEYYYSPDLENDQIILSPEEARHCIKVMHHRVGDTIFVVDGKGCLAESVVVNIDKVNAVLHITRREYGIGKRDFILHIAIAPTKNRERIEWFLEKAVEVGVEKVSFIICEHSERPRLEMARLERITVAAMKQSHTAYMPDLEVISFEDCVLQNDGINGEKLIAWCEAGAGVEQLARLPLVKDHITLLIGPEGDFSEQEVRKALEYGFREVKLGNKRLRTETAGLYGCCVIAGIKEVKR